MEKEISKPNGVIKKYDLTENSTRLHRMKDIVNKTLSKDTINNKNREIYK